jgi:thiamine biosynthesis lipoprotein ApbE
VTGGAWLHDREPAKQDDRAARPRASAGPCGYRGSGPDSSCRRRGLGGGARFVSGSRHDHGVVEHSLVERSDRCHERVRNHGIRRPVVLVLDEDRKHRADDEYDEHRFEHRFEHDSVECDRAQLDVRRGRERHDQRRQLTVSSVDGKAGVVTRADQHERHAAAHGLAQQRWNALGTSVHLVVTAPAQLEVARNAVEAVLARIDMAASRFRDDSELTRINGANGRWVEVSPTLRRALRVALDAAEWTGGLVDPTVGAALIDLGYDRTFSLVPADGPAPVIRVREVPGWRQVELDDDASRVRMPPGTVVDLGATAKGLAADLASEEAAAAAGCGVLVGLGGDISVAGDPPAVGWSITVGDTAAHDVPVGAEREQVIGIRDGGLATSSIRARRWRRGGSELHHLIDPRVGRPSAGTFRTVTVAASTCTLANAASTAAIVLGVEAPGWLTARALPARLVSHDGTVHHVGGWPHDGEAAR